MGDLIDERCVILVEDHINQPNGLKELFNNLVKAVEYHRSKGIVSLIVIDDLLNEIQGGKLGDGLVKLITAGRHMWTTVWIITQGLFKAGGGGYVPCDVLL